MNQSGKGLEVASLALDGWDPRRPDCSGTAGR